ncbi:acyl-protein thioesterase 2-like [Stegodyphus dumicola]|uniref:acyl-protein thioesterase 2-like n=1 Tax=Stegodyphus dumicola TaxID=202533 RepID=UPI0015AF7921|nr:acyl-protein thioesterase 2-like [Stegodyphus dumicola]
MSSSPVVISAASKHTASVIFLHGLGDTGHGWAASLQLQRIPHVKYICPTAPTMPVTLNNGYRMPSWFDLRSLDADGPEDEEGIKRASEAVFQMIANEEEKGIPSHRIALGGFSQGGALALYSALRCTKPLAGVVALSCWLPLYKQFPVAAVGNLDIPVLQCHGELDTVVPYKWGKMTHELLKTFMTNVELKTFNGLCHTSCETEMNEVKVFLERILP